MPTGLHFLVTGYGFSEGGIATDPSAVLQNPHLTVHGPVLGYGHTFGVAGKSAKFDVVLPWAFVSGSADLGGVRQERNISGMADPKVRVSVNFYGSPALTLKEFRGYRQDLIIGASLQVSLPFGQYDPERLVNIGTNRWAFKPEIGISKAWGPVTLDLAAAATLFTTNTDFFGGKTREQDPV